MTTMIPKQYLTISEICTQYGMSRSTFYRIRESGNFPTGVMISPGKIGWIVTEVRDWWSNLNRQVGLERKRQPDGV